MNLPAPLGLALALASISIGGIAPRSARAAEFNVNSTADLVDVSLGDGLCRTASLTCTLRAAIQEANALAGPDRINVPTGTYSLAIAGKGEDLSATGDLDVSDSLDLFGAGPDLTIIDARQLDRVFDVQTGVSASFDGVAIRGGSATGSPQPGFLGGGLLARSFSSIDLSDCEISGNVANAGAGVSVEDMAIATVTNCRLQGNRALDLGLTDPRGSAVLSEGEIDIDQSEASGNSSAAPFGTIYSEDASGTMAVRNSTISGNQDIGVGSLDTELDVESSTIEGNSSHGLAFSTATGTDALSVRNTILADSGGNDCLILGAPVFLDFAGEHNLASDATCPLDGGINDFPSTDPLLGALLDNAGTGRSHVPLRGSPVIDTGNEPRCDDFDQRGAARPLDGDGNGSLICDIGAVEVLPCNGEADAELANTTISSMTEVVACFTIAAGPDVQVIAGGDLTLRARDTVTLRNGFSVTGGALRVVRDPASGSGMVLP